VRKKYDLIFLCDAAIVFPFQRIRSSSVLITHRRDLAGSLTIVQITKGDEVWSVKPNFWIAKRARSIKKPAAKGQKTHHPDYPKFSNPPVLHFTDHPTSVVGIQCAFLPYSSFSL